MIDVHYFASVRERLGLENEQVDCSTVTDIDGLLAVLVQRHGEKGQRVLGDVRVLAAVNQVVVARSAPVRDGDEVAFFPPVTGG